jgi:hypothetical protein
MGEDGREARRDGRGKVGRVGRNGISPSPLYLHFFFSHAPRSQLHSNFCEMNWYEARGVRVVADKKDESCKKKKKKK